jgi:hypothetical protein
MALAIAAATGRIDGFAGAGRRQLGMIDQHHVYLAGRAGG